MPTTETEQNKAISRRFCDVMNTNDVEIISRTINELVEPDALIRTLSPIGFTGARALKEVFLRLHRAYPDLHITVEDLIAEDDKVVSRNVVTGSQRGEYMGIQPTGNPSSTTRYLSSASSTAVTETWGVVDVLSQLRQLDAIPG